MADDTGAIEYSHWQVFVGRSLTNQHEPPVDIILDPATVQGLESAHPEYWRAILTVIKIDLSKRAA